MVNVRVCLWGRGWMEWNRHPSQRKKMLYSQETEGNKRDKHNRKFSVINASHMLAQRVFIRETELAH